jgi:hypothetical protein
MVSIHSRAMWSWSQPCVLISLLFYYPREGHLRSRRLSLQFRSSYAKGEMLASALDLETILLHLEYPMKMSDWEGQVMNATWPDSATGSVTHAWKEKLHGRPWRSSSRLSRYLLVSTTNASFIIFLCSPSFRKSRDEISFKGEGCNIPCYGNPNQGH